MVEEEVYDKVVEVSRVSDRVISLAIVVEEVLSLAYAYAPQSGISMDEFFLRRSIKRMDYQ